MRAKHSRDATGIQPGEGGAIPTRALHRPWVYVAGPFSDDPAGNTLRATCFGDVLWDAGFFPYVPHLTLNWEGRSYQHWMRFHATALERCDMLFRFPGESPGADFEVQLAQLLGLPVFDVLEDLLAGRETNPL